MCEVALSKEDITPNNAAWLLLLADRHNLVKLEKVRTLLIKSKYQWKSIMYDGNQKCNSVIHSMSLLGSELTRRLT